MSDFIYTNEKINPSLLTDNLKSIYDMNGEILEFHGEWGTLAVKSTNLKTNNVYVDDKNIIVALGNPYTLNNFERQINVSYFKNKVDWSEIISGPFLVLIIDRIKNEVHFITDLMSFIPIYLYKDKSKKYISTHVDLLANSTNQNNNRDEISELDFILNGSVTYPYTCYKKIKQLAAGTEYNLNSNGDVTSNQYWAPYEDYSDASLKELSIELRNYLKSDIEAVASDNSDIGHFLSGGEDSRVISGMLEHYKKDGYVFLDSYNREGKIAKKIANIYNSNLSIKFRSQSYYLDILKDCSEMVGKGIEYKHGHAFNFVKECNLDKYDYVFGGLFSDALLKGSHIKKDKTRQKLLFLPQRKSKELSLILKKTKVYNQEILDKLNDRRIKHFNFIKYFRNHSAREWFELYPSTMNNNVGNYHVNRRLFNSYEPFLSNNIIKFSAKIPQDYKLDRKIFNLAFKPYLSKSKFIMHGDGFFPYFSKSINGYIQFNFKIFRKFSTIFSNTNQGSWSDWNKLMKSKKWEIFVNNLKINNSFYSYINYGIKDLLNGDSLNIYQKLNLMQVIYLNNFME